MQSMLGIVSAWGFSHMRKYIVEDSDVRKMAAGFYAREGIACEDADSFSAYNRHREAAFRAYKDIIVQEKKSGRILDVGCGNGYFLSLLDPGEWDRFGG